MNARRIFEWGGLAAGIVLIAFGIGAIAMGVDGRSTVRDSLKQEQVFFGEATDPAVAEHASKWAGEQVTTGDQARAFALVMREHTLESEEQIHTESLRYSVDMPGQALAYKMGSRGFRDLRAKAERALGSAFDVRRFHDVILTSGSMPMKTLEAHVDRWIKEMGKQPEIVR